MKKYLVIAKWTISVDKKIRLLGDKFEVDEATLATLNPELVEIVEELPEDDNQEDTDSIDEVLQDDNQEDTDSIDEVLQDDNQEDTDNPDETSKKKPKKRGKNTAKGGNNDTDTTETD